MLSREDFFDDGNRVERQMRLDCCCWNEDGTMVTTGLNTWGLLLTPQLISGACQLTSPLQLRQLAGGVQSA